MSFRSRRRPVSTDRRFRRKNNGADYGPPERWQHSGRALQFTEQAGVLAARATEEHIVDVMVLRNLLSKNQSDAAFRFKRDYQRARLDARVTGSYNPASGGADYFYGAHERDDNEEAAYRRWRHAVRELGERRSGVVISTVCHDLLPVPRDIPLLQSALEQLAEWYGIR